MKNLLLAFVLSFSLFGMSFINVRYAEPNAALAVAPTPRPTQTPVPRSCPIGATAKCKDGTCSYSQNRRGTCSYHGGVAEWY